MNGFLKTLLLFFFILPFISCKPFPPEMDIKDAIKSYAAQIKVTGINVDSVMLSITVPNPTTITIPAGIHLQSSSPMTQNMITAVTTRVVVDPSNVNVQVDQKIEVYCINRFLEAPTTSSSFAVDTSETNDADAVQSLAKCLDAGNIDHNMRQLAIWMQSDTLMYLTKKQVKKRLKVYYQNYLETKIAERSQQILVKYRTDSPEFDSMSDDEVLGDIKRLIPRLTQQDVNSEIELYRKKAGPLLEACGVDISTKPFFQ